MKSRLIALGLGAATLAMPVFAATPAAPVTMTGDQGHQNMIDQLKIKTLRPAFNGDSNPANYDEARANPYPDWPDILTLKSGAKVTTAAQWVNKRRPEIVEDFEREVVGRVPANAPKVTWTTGATETERVSGKNFVATQLIGHVDNAIDPAIDVDIHVMLLLPAGATVKPVPLLIMFGANNARFPAPTQPTPDDLARINTALKADLAARDPSLAAVFASHPGYDLIATGANLPESRVLDLMNDGWGVALLDTNSVQPDNAAALTRGIIGLTNKGQPRKPDDWGALRAWSWGASRTLDYLTTRPEIDAKHIGIEGVSRWGKGALVAMAFDQRFAFGLVGSSGEGGVKPHRRNFGEAVENLTGGEYYWMAGNFLKYGGPKTAGDLPVDSHELIALCAPRGLFISYGAPSGGDPLWSDVHGSYMATVAAGVTWKLLGAKDLGVGNDYKSAQLPPVNTGQLDGQLAWRQHDGGHTDAPNMSYFLKWADAQMDRTSTLP